MLSERTIAIVKSTAPILEVKGTEITTVFYSNMFKAHPELLNIFNQVNQKRGRQQAALANTVYAAAKYIDQLDVLLPAVKQIAHKHRSLAVKAEHYPIVGEHLLQAIKQVLGDAATDEILAAWGEAYGIIADVFISVEKDMYEEAESQVGGWKDYKKFNVLKKVKESNIITSFYLKPSDNKKLPLFIPGQYITVRVSIPGEKYLLNRQYSLTQVPNEDYYRISVKKEINYDDTPEGTVSNYLHDMINEGDTIEVTVPAGDFVLNEVKEPVYFIAGGVGITPFMSMLHSLMSQNENHTVSLLYAVKNEQLQAFGTEIAEFMKKNPYFRAKIFYDEIKGQIEHTIPYASGRISKDELLSIVNDTNARYYVCGPIPFMKAIISELKLLGVDQESIHYEFFGPAVAIEEAVSQ